VVRISWALPAGWRRGLVAAGAGLRIASACGSSQGSPLRNCRACSWEEKTYEIVVLWTSGLRRLVEGIPASRAAFIDVSAAVNAVRSDDPFAVSGSELCDDEEVTCANNRATANILAK